MDKQPRTFISYSRADQVFALKLAKVLKKAGIEIRLDNLKLQAGAGGVAHLPKNIPHAPFNPLRQPHKGVILQSQTREELDAFLSSVLRPSGGAFKGEL